jgi:hypothetical protein
MWAKATERHEELRSNQVLYDDLMAMRRLWYEGYITDDRANKLEAKLIRKLDAQKRKEA